MSTVLMKFLACVRVLYKAEKGGKRMRFMVFQCLVFIENSRHLTDAIFSRAFTFWI